MIIYFKWYRTYIRVNVISEGVMQGLPLAEVEGTVKLHLYCPLGLLGLL